MHIIVKLLLFIFNYLLFYQFDVLESMVLLVLIILIDRACTPINILYRLLKHCFSYIAMIYILLPLQTVLWIKFIA